MADNPLGKVELKTAIRYFTEVQKHLELNKPGKLGIDVIFFSPCCPHYPRLASSLVPRLVAHPRDDSAAPIFSSSIFAPSPLISPSLPSDLSLSNQSRGTSPKMRSRRPWRIILRLTRKAS